MERFRRLATILFVIVAMLAPVARGNAFAQADTLTCDDFTNQDAAQIVLDEDDTFAETLDEDGDGEACPDLPVRESSEVSVVLGLGFPRVEFEDENGEASDVDGAEDFEIGEEYTGFDDYDSISIYWDEDFAAHIIVVLNEELDEDAAFENALNFLPTTADMESGSEELDEGELLFTGHVDALEDVFDQDVYDAYEVGGDSGDVRIILVPGDEDFAVLDIAIGLGEDYVGGGTEPKPTEAASGDAEEYLGSVRDSVDVLLDESETFTNLFLGGETLSETDLDVLVEILVHWSTVSEESDALTAPDGFEEIQSAFEDTTAAFESISAIIAEGENADVEQAIANFDEAQTLLEELDGLLADEEA